MNLNPNHYNLLGYARGHDGMDMLFADTAGTNDACFQAYEQGWMQGMDEYERELAECDDPSSWVDTIEDEYDYDDTEAEAPYEDDFLYDDPADLYPEW